MPVARLPAKAGRPAVGGRAPFFDLCLCCPRDRRGKSGAPPCLRASVVNEATSRSSPTGKRRRSQNPEVAGSNPACGIEWGTFAVVAQLAEAAE
jgi:hypothetical protein